MQHDWVIDVLCDLQAYAARNGLMALAGQTEALLVLARAEIARQHRATAAVGRAGAEPGQNEPVAPMVHGPGSRRS